MIEEIDTATYVKHYMQKVLGELGDDPVSFLKAAIEFIRAETDFFSRDDASATLQQLLTPCGQAPKAASAPPPGVQPPTPAAAVQVPPQPVPDKPPAAAIAPVGGVTAPQEAAQQQQEAGVAVKAEAAEAQAGQEGAEEAEDQPQGLKPNAGNGADLQRYSWTQTLSECVVTVPVPPGTKGRMCDVQITRGKLKVGVKGQPVVLEGELYAAVKPDDSLWNLMDGKLLEITLQKADSMQWWRAVVKGEPEIDTQSVEPESSKLTDLDPEMRATVEKMMYDQRQKALGLPTSEEQHKQEVMNRFMAAHPEMDFSNAKFV